jgi:hypothetical protein
LILSRWRLFISALDPSPPLPSLAAAIMAAD